MRRLALDGPNCHVRAGRHPRRGRVAPASGREAVRGGLGQAPGEDLPKGRAVRARRHAERLRHRVRVRRPRCHGAFPEEERVRLRPRLHRLRRLRRLCRLLRLLRLRALAPRACRLVDAEYLTLVRAEHRQHGAEHLQLAPRGHRVVQALHDLVPAPFPRRPEQRLEQLAPLLQRTPDRHQPERAFEHRSALRRRRTQQGLRDEGRPLALVEARLEQCKERSNARARLSCVVAHRPPRGRQVLAALRATAVGCGSRHAAHRGAPQRRRAARSDSGGAAVRGRCVALHVIGGSAARQRRPAERELEHEREPVLRTQDGERVRELGA
mmetsp:Transcript_11586/g.29342  ORF Transcript_11586/g.29342 Transcript_11586/m.29342 type:complete len:325 (-) Transcript_11586:358-1332(-)